MQDHRSLIAVGGGALAYEQIRDAQDRNLLLCDHPRREVGLRALVTGVAGFIGSHLAERLVQLGHVVDGIDCLTSYYPVETKRRNLSEIAKSDNFHFIEKDILEADLSNLVGRADVIFHLAAQPGVRASWSTFDQYLRNNLLVTQFLLEKCGEVGKKRLIFASSSSVYGNAERYPTREDAVPLPISPYGVTKEGAERICGLYQSSRVVQTVILRYFTVYGPRQRPDMGFHRFIESMLRNSPITVYGDGKQIRDFTYVSDIVEGTICAAESEVAGETINLGGGSPAELNGVLEILRGITGSESKIVYVKEDRGDVRKTTADITKARNVLDYRPAMKLLDGLIKQVQWQRDKLS